MRILMGILLVAFMVLGLASPVFGLGQETIMNNVYDPAHGTLRIYEKDISGTMILHRDDITGDDRLDRFPAAGQSNIILGFGEDLSGFQKAIVHVQVSQDSGCIITPMFGNSTASRYFNGDGEQVSEDSIFMIDVNGSDDFFVSIGDVSNPNGTLIDVFVIPTN